jgi:hypothetical protein
MAVPLLVKAALFGAVAYAVARAIKSHQQMSPSTDVSGGSSMLSNLTDDPQWPTSSSSGAGPTS